MDNCATHPHDGLFLQNIIELFTKLQKCDVFHKAWIQLGSEKGDNFRCKAFVNNRLATWGNSWVKSCVTIMRVIAAVGMRKRRMNTILCQQWVKPKPVLLKNLNYFFYVQAGEHHKNFWTWNWCSFVQKLRFQSKQFSFIYFFGKKVISAHRH